MRQINVLEGNVVAKEGMKVGIIASRFNEIIVNKLLGGAVDGLVRHGVNEENITAAWVPGAFEIPVVASKMASSGEYDAVICVGAVIRGDTTHYDYVCNEVSKGVAQVGLATGIPVLFGVIVRLLTGRQTGQNLPWNDGSRLFTIVNRIILRQKQGSFRRYRSSFRDPSL